MHQVAKNASKVRKRDTSWVHFGPFGLTFEARRAIFGIPWRIFAHFKVRFLYFCAIFIIFSAICCIFVVFP